MKNFDGNRVNDRIGTYSSRGPSRLDYILKPDLVAPGNKVISLGAAGSSLYNDHAGTNQIPWSLYSAITLPTSSLLYFSLSGTSMAAPVTSGAAALMCQQNPSLSPDVIKARLMLSADKWSDPLGSMDPCTYGSGYLNIPAALASSAVLTQPANSPRLTTTKKGSVLVNLDQAIWGVD